MNIDRKVIEQALEALEQSYSDLLYDYAGRHHAYAFEADIAALREALAQPVQQEPVAAQQRFRHPQKTMPDWSPWQPCKVADRPAWQIDSQGYEVEYRALYTSPQAAQPQPVQQDHYKELAALGWQAIECPVCGSSAQGYPRQAAQPLAETQSDSLNTLCKMLHSGEEVEGDDGLAMLVPMDLWNEAQEAIELLIGEDDGTEAAHGITKGTT